MKRILSAVIIISIILSTLTFCSVGNDTDAASVKFSTEKDMLNYPRPQFFRENWLNLNGKWDFAFDDHNIGEENEYYINFPEDKQEITVPYTYETPLSGINDQKIHNFVWYKKSIVLSEEDISKRMLLHFEGSDYYTKVWINGEFAGENVGGYHRFSFDISSHLKAGENNITVKAEDSLSVEQARGKQRYQSDSFSCWYIQTTGIWKTVWLEKVSDNYFKSIKCTPNYGYKTVTLEYDLNISHYDINKYRYRIETIISYNGEVVNNVSTRPEGETVQSTIFICSDKEAEIKNWSPEQPNLYDIEYRLYRNDEVYDTVKSYFGVRQIKIDGDKILLNDNELHLKMLLDQGYWKDSHLTAPDGQALVDDIDIALKYGYNGVRKHQKIEDERFLYWCDVKGVFVWSEMASFYNYTNKSTTNFTDEWVKIVNQNYNHPSIITWVPFNESWGFGELADAYSKQQVSFINSIYYLTKSLDSTRPVITNDGWEHTISDIITIHDYRQNGDSLYAAYTDDKLEILNGLIAYSCGKKLYANGYHYNGQPVIMSEYGGIALQSDSGWGYGEMASSEEDFLEKFRSVTNAVAKIPYISGYCYTQITDVQQEINGLLKEDRTDKFSEKTIKEICKINQEAFMDK